MLDTPIISGIEDIILSIGDNFTNTDNTFDVNLGKISNFNEIEITHSIINSNVEKVSVGQASGNITFGEGFNWMYLDTVPGENIVISTLGNSTIHVSNGTNNLNLIGGKIAWYLHLENSSVKLDAPNATGNIKILSNGDVTIQMQVGIEIWTLAPWVR